MHDLFGEQRRAACTLPFLHRAVGRFELGPRHHVQLRHLCRDALLQRAIEGESRIRDPLDLERPEPFDLSALSAAPSGPFLPLRLTWSGVAIFFFFFPREIRFIFSCASFRVLFALLHSSSSSRFSVSGYPRNANRASG